MGAGNSKEAFRKAIVDLTSHQSVSTQDESFWDRYWSDPSLTPHDFFALITRDDVHNLREKASGNLTALCFKVVERINNATATACSGPHEHTIVLNCVRLLTRILPFLFEAPDWRLLFWAPANFAEAHDGEQPQALAQVLLNTLADLLFCPDFTVLPKTKQGPENPDDLSALDSCEYIWDVGIGCLESPGTTKQIDSNRTEILKLLVTCFSEPLYLLPEEVSRPNHWLAHFTSPENRHILPLLTSLINVICSYDPVGYGVPYYYALVRDPRGELVEASCQLLALLLDYTPPSSHGQHQATPIGHAHTGTRPPILQEPGLGNLFCSYVSRLHQEEDMELMVRGFTSLLCNPLKQTYLPSSIKKIFFTQELYIIFWKLFELNKKFLAHILRSPALFDLVVPLLHQVLETRTNPALVGMLHVGVFILLLLSGERNFGVRLNKPYVQKTALSDIPKFSGTHADLLFLVFHKIITSGLPRLQPLYDCLLTVMVNVSPYLKSLSMVTCARLMHLMESFSTPWFLFAKATNHYLVFYLLEILNNVIQYQFDGNTNLVYSLIRSKMVFYQLVNLPEDSCLLPRPRPSQGVAATPPGCETSVDATPSLPSVAPEPSVAETHHEDGQENGEEDADEDEGIEGRPQPSLEPRDSSVDGSGSRDRSPMPVAEIEPPGRIQTIAVEVEPLAGGGSDPSTPKSVTPPPQPAATPPPQQQGMIDQQLPDQSSLPATTGSTPAETTPIAPPTATPTTAPSRQDIPMHTFLSGPPMTFYDAPKPGKKGRPKPKSRKDLLPLHQDVGPRTKQLLEPSTPDFKATPEWVHSWKQKLPLNTILRVLQVLVPQVEKLCADNNVKSEHEILEYLKNGTLVGLLPVPHPILIRKYQPSESTELWFHTYIWGVVYVRNYSPPIWYDTSIRLFQVTTPGST